jgi:predicted Zn-dependent protease
MFKKPVAGIVSVMIASASFVVPVQLQGNAAPQKAGSVYQKAQAELNEDLYVLYRIIDRIARANGLDQRPWRIAIGDKYELNAFAADANLLAVYNGILDQAAGDASAMACVIGHEMAHHVKRHIPVGEAQKAALITQMKAEAEKEAKEEVASAQAESIAGGILGNILGNVVGGSWGSRAGNVVQNVSRNRANNINERINQIFALKQAELERRLAEQSQAQEVEADELGYTYVVRAGFSPDGCTRMLQVLNQTAGAEFSGTHPSIPTRLEKMRGLARKYSTEKLKAEGNKRLSTIPPLTYSKSKDGLSLRVNSSRGGSSKVDLEKMFGQ